MTPHHAIYVGVWSDPKPSSLPRHFFYMEPSLQNQHCILMVSGLLFFRLTMCNRFQFSHAGEHPNTFSYCFPILKKLYEIFKYRIFKNLDPSLSYACLLPNLSNLLSLLVLKIEYRNVSNLMRCQEDS